MLDVVRMTRALRPEGIVWPSDTDGKPTNRLELLTKLNHVDHANAHDALNDVYATIAITKLIQEKQPKLFHYLLEMRDKKKVASLIQNELPFLYTSGSYPSEYQKTTIATYLSATPNGGALVYDLRHDPKAFASLSVEQLVERWRFKRDRPADELPLPIKHVRYNRCPAVAPISVLDPASEERIQLPLKVATQHAASLKDMPEFIAKVQQAHERLEQDRPQVALIADEHAVDGQLYDGFLDDRDHTMMETVRTSDAHQLAALDPQFHDVRLSGLWPLYKARNFSSILSDEERAAWEVLCARRLTSGGTKSRLARYFGRLQTLAQLPHLSAEKQYLLEELQLYGESIAPAFD